MWTLGQLVVPVLVVACVLGAVGETDTQTTGGQTRDTKLDLGVGLKSVRTPSSTKDKKLKYQKRVKPAVPAQVESEQQVIIPMTTWPVNNLHTSNGVELIESSKGTNTKLSREKDHRLNHRKYPKIKTQNGRDQSRSTLRKGVRTWRQKQRNQTSATDQIKNVHQESPTRKRTTTIHTSTRSVQEVETVDSRNRRHRRPIWHHRHQQHHIPRKRRSPGAFMVNDRTTLNPFITITQALDFLSSFDAQPVPSRWPVSMILPDEVQTPESGLQPEVDALDESTQATTTGPRSTHHRKYDRRNSMKRQCNHLTPKLSNTTTDSDHTLVACDLRKKALNKRNICRFNKNRLSLRKRKKCRGKNLKSRKGGKACQIESRNKTSQERKYKLPVSNSDVSLAQNDEPSSLKRLDLVDQNEERSTIFLERKSLARAETTVSALSSETSSLSPLSKLSHMGFHEDTAIEDREQRSTTSRARHGRKSSRKHSGDRKTAGAADQHSAVKARVPYHAKLANPGESTPSYREPLDGDRTTGRQASLDKHVRHSQSSGILSSPSPFLINFNQRSNWTESHVETGSSDIVDVVRRNPDQNTPEGTTPAHTFRPTNSGLQSENYPAIQISEAVGAGDAADYPILTAQSPPAPRTTISYSPPKSEAITAMEKATRNRTQEIKNDYTPRSNSSQINTHVPDLSAARLWKEKMLKKASTEPTSNAPRTQPFPRGNHNPAAGTSRRGRLGTYMRQTTTASTATRQKLWDKAVEESVTKGSPFIGHTTAVNFLGGQTQRASRTSHEGRREAKEFNRFMGEGMCEIFNKHYVPINIGGKCV